MESPRPDDTREKVLDAAERLFSEKGYNAVSVREITGEAGVHLSAVNYYFGSKKNLYLEVFRSRILPQSRPFKKALDYLEGGEVDLPALIQTMIGSFIRSGRGHHPDMVKHGPLFFREMADPSEAFDLVMDQIFKPAHNRIKRILALGMNREVEDEQLTFYTMASMALVRHFIHSDAVIQRVFEKDLDEDFMERIIRYLTDFLMRGLDLEEKP